MSRTCTTRQLAVHRHLALVALAGALAVVTGTTTGLLAAATVLGLTALRAWVVHVGAGVLTGPQQADPLHAPGDPGQRVAHAA